MTLRAACIIKLVQRVSLMDFLVKTAFSGVIFKQVTFSSQIKRDTAQPSCNWQAALFKVESKLR